MNHEASGRSYNPAWVLTQPLSFLFNASIRRWLFNGGVTSVSELCGMTVERLLEIRGIGPARYLKIAEALARHDLSLSEPLPVTLVGRLLDEVVAIDDGEVVTKSNCPMTGSVSISEITHIAGRMTCKKCRGEGTVDHPMKLALDEVLCFGGQGWELTEEAKEPITCPDCAGECYWDCEFETAQIVDHVTAAAEKQLRDVLPSIQHEIDEAILTIRKVFDLAQIKELNE